MSKSFKVKNLLSDNKKISSLELERYNQLPFIVPILTLTQSSNNLLSMEIHQRQINSNQSNSDMEKRLELAKETTQSLGASTKKGRAAFTASQLMQLEREFKRNEYLPRLRRINLATTLNLSEKQIKIWFQNRRVKEKKSGEKHKNCCQKFESLYASEQNKPEHCHETLSANHCQGCEIIGFSGSRR